MAMFSYRDLTTEQLRDTAEIAKKGFYADDPIPGGYKAVTPEDLGLDESAFEGGNEKGWYYKGSPELLESLYPDLGALGALDARALPLISNDGKTVAISFRGTDSALDLLSYPSLAFDAYLGAFDSLLDAVARFIEPGQRVLITGHSLGAGAANQLADVADEQYDGVFKDAYFVTFATPIVSSSSNILNIGHENDWVFLSGTVGRPADDTTTDNIVYFDKEYSEADPLTDRFDVFDISSHPIESYIDTVKRVTGSSRYDDMTRDSVVIIDAIDNAQLGPVSDKLSLTSSHFGQAAYILGEDGADDILLGGDAADVLEGFSGSDELDGGSGDDILYGGPDDDPINVDIMTGGPGKDQFWASTGSDVIRNANPDIKEFNPDEDSLWLPEDTEGSFNGYTTVLTYLNGTVALEGVDLGPHVAAKEYPWLEWNGDLTMIA